MKNRTLIISIILVCVTITLALAVTTYAIWREQATDYSEVQVPEESVVIAALFHDLCKVNLYTTEKRNRKNSAGQWESYDAYTIQEKFCFGGHGSKSVFLARHFISLTPEEAVAINCHMSSWDGNTNVGKAFEQFPFAWLLHVADESATYIIEKES